jgi:hypothetical protein
MLRAVNDPTGGRPERRRHARIIAKGAVVVRAQGQTQQGRIANLGVGGIYVATQVTAPERWLARSIDLEIRLDAGRAEWLAGGGKIIRIDAGGLAVAFDEASSAAMLRMIDEVTTASHSSARVLAVVLIDADAPRRSSMAAGFRAAGCSVVEASTPLEAIVRLGESSFEPDVIAVADSSPTGAAEDMRGFVEREHPRAKLVTIGDELLQPDGISHWLSSSDPNIDLPQRVLDVLVRTRKPTHH